MDFLLSPLSHLVFIVTGQHVHPEQLIFLISLILSFIGSYIYKHYVQTSRISFENQLVISSLFGAWIFYLNWGWFIWIPVLDVVVSYLLVRFISPSSSHRYVFVFSMLVLALCHLRTLYLFVFYTPDDASGDYTGTMMVITQRITSLSFSIADGFSNRHDLLSDNQKKHAVRKIPSFTEYFSYSFCFLGIIAGPLVFYNHFMEHMRPKRDEDGKPVSSPSSIVAVTTKWCMGLIFIAVFWIGGEYLPPTLSMDPQYISTTPLWRRMFYVYFSMFVARSKYYGVWLICDAINNEAGIGFNGYTANGKPKWDLISNINIPNIEFATGLKTYIDNWNIMTVQWIRLISYDRLQPKYRTLGSFILSAFWHGFLPGYYMMFLTAHIFLLVQRKVRRAIRPKFQNSSKSRFFYEVVTFLATQMAIGYSVVPFVLLEWNGSFQFYKSMWFCGHVIGFAMLLLVPASRSQSAKSKTDQSEQSNGKKQVLIGSNGSNHHHQD
nr:membrane-bound O-acyltransferase domain-containing protein 2 [Ciona intestinalis]|eukprot:XP_002120717.1 membrane-bound O-acyltransferase domain-containing protein 2 [Ciona intestinalis]